MNPPLLPLDFFGFDAAAAMAALNALSGASRKLMKDPEWRKQAMHVRYMNYAPLDKKTKNNCSWCVCPLTAGSVIRPTGYALQELFQCALSTGDHSLCEPTCRRAQHVISSPALPVV